MLPSSTLPRGVGGQKPTPSTALMNTISIELEHHFCKPCSFFYCSCTDALAE
jgi:hypothetical protein